MAEKKKGGGGKLSRSEIVTVRLDPKLRFAAELAARKQRRTLSSFIEWAIEKIVSEEITAIADGGTNPDTAYQAMMKIWDIEEADRFINFASKYPGLMNFDEERLIKLIEETPYFFKNVKRIADSTTLEWEPTLENILIKRVRRQWDLLNKIVSGSANEKDLPEISEEDIISIPF